MILLHVYVHRPLVKMYMMFTDAVTYLRDAVTTAQLVRRNDVDAIEIHTNGR